MSSAQASAGEYRAKKINSKDEWLDGNSNTVFEGRDQVLNTLNGNSSDADMTDKTLEGGGFDPEHVQGNSNLKEATPYGKEASGIGHEVVNSDNFERHDGDSILNDQNGRNDLEFEEGGTFYNMSIHEFFRHAASSNSDLKADRNNLDEIPEELDVLTVHTVVYQEPSGQEHIVHWDPGKRTSSGKKKKYVEKGGEPSTEARLKSANVDFFEDYGNNTMKDGLRKISSALRDMKDKFYAEADRNMEMNSARDEELAEKFDTGNREETVEKFQEYKDKLDVPGKEMGYSQETKEKIWKAERWRAMADAVDSFAESYRQEKPVHVDASL